MPDDAKVQAIQERIADKLNPDDLAGSRVMAGGGLPASFMPQSFGELMEFGKLMSVCHGIPVHLRGKPGDCLQVAMQAVRWGMDPFAVANKSYFVNDRMAYEAQLVSAVVYASNQLHGRLDVRYDGEGEGLVCTVVGNIKGDPRPHEVRQEIKTITVRNSPLWKQAPRQQIAYYTTREWARLYMPDVLMGVYTPEELDETRHHGADNAKDITPRPQQSDYVADADEPDLVQNEDMPDDYELCDGLTGESLGVFGPKKFSVEISTLIGACTKRPVLKGLMENNHDQIERLKGKYDSYETIRDDAKAMWERLTAALVAQDGGLPGAEETKPQTETEYDAGPLPKPEPEPEPEPETAKPKAEAKPQAEPKPAPSEEKDPLAWIEVFETRMRKPDVKAKAIDNMLGVVYADVLAALAKTDKPRHDALVKEAKERSDRLKKGG